MIKNGELTKSEARFHPNKNIITRALGASGEAIPDFFEVSLKNEDIILMCSDGLSNMIDDTEIFETVSSRRDKIKSAVRALIEKANEYGGKDNITAIVVKP